MTLSSRQEELRTQQRQKLAILFRITPKRIPIYVPSFIYLRSSKRYYSRHPQAVSRPPLLPTAFCTFLSLKTHSSRPEESPYLWKKSSIMAISIRNTPLKNKLQNKQARGKENDIVMHASFSAAHSVNDFTRSHKEKKTSWCNNRTPFHLQTDMQNTIAPAALTTTFSSPIFDPNKQKQPKLKPSRIYRTWRASKSHLTRKNTLATSTKNPHTRSPTVSHGFRKRQILCPTFPSEAWTKEEARRKQTRALTLI